MRLVCIPKDKYDGYRLDVIFDGYKWDPQFMDNNTVAKHALILTNEEAAKVAALTEQLTTETVMAENILNSDLSASHPLSITRQTRRVLFRMKNYKPQNHVRLMRFDFHPLIGGDWAISEVNSDVPGGFAEGSLMPAICAKALGGSLSYIDFGEKLTEAISARVPKGGRIAFVHCTSYSDDRQVMQFLGDKLQRLGYTPVYLAADHIKFVNGRAECLLDGQKGTLDGIVRFTPLEWLIKLPKNWHGYFDTVTPSCNHPIAVFAQTKRFPFVWDYLKKKGVPMNTWRKLLPETIEAKQAHGKTGFIYKPAYGRVGENISIKSAISKDEFSKIMKDVRRHPKRYVAQKMFDSLPLTSDEGEQFHLCLGSYSIDGKFAGFYARVSRTARIDSNAADIPVLIEE